MEKAASLLVFPFPFFIFSSLSLSLSGSWSNFRHAWLPELLFPVPVFSHPEPRFFFPLSRFEGLARTKMPGKTKEG